MSLPIAQLPDFSGTAVFVLRLLLATTVVWLLAGAVNLLLGRWSASLRHRVWSMSMAATFVLPVLVALAPQWQIAHIAPALIRAGAPARQLDAVPQPAIEHRIADSNFGNAPEETSISPLRPTQRLDDAKVSAPAAAPLPIAAPSRTSVLRPNASSQPIPRLLWFAVVWAIVALWLLARQGLSLLIAANVVRRGQSIEKGVAVRELSRLAIKLNVAAHPPLRQSDEIRTPICVGCVWPCILLPVDHVRWDAEQLSATLTHELAHVVRRDVLWQMAARLACAVYWFHPLAWIAAWRMRVERELACDDWVLRGGESSTRYARWLVDMADSLTGRAPAAERVGVAMASPHGFQSRLAAILDPRRTRVPLSRRATLLIALAAGTVLIALAVLNPLAPTRASAAPTPASPATQPSGAPQTQPAKDERPQRTVHLSFVDAASSEPISGVIGTYWPDQQTSDNYRNYTSDAKGNADCTFTAEAKSLSFFYHKGNYVQGLVELGGEFGVAALADGFTLHMQRGLTVGGIIEDEGGKGVAGAKVQITFIIPAPNSPGRMVANYGSAETDAQGHWAFNGAPAHPDQIEIHAKHPDFMMKSFGHRYGPGQFDALLAKNLVSMIQRGVTVTGDVVDASGKGIPKPTIAPDGFGLISETTGDEKGHFELGGVEPGPRTLVVKADGYALQLAKVTAAPAMAPMLFRMEKSPGLRGRIVDEKGAAVPNAIIAIEKWRTVPRVGVYIHAEADGSFVWNEAPVDEFTLSASSSNRLLHGKPLTAIAGDKEVVITVSAPQRTMVRGKVVDDQTGKPIDRFAIHVLTSHKGGGAGMDRAGMDGTYEVAASFPGDNFEIRISANGYLPAESAVLKPEENVVQFDARLKRDGGMSGTVLMPDGKPATGADVVLIEKGAATVTDGALTGWAKSDNPSTVTDAAGHFQLPSRKGDIKLMLFHDSGWNIIKTKAEDSLQKLQLRAWCKIDGVLMKGDKPWPNQTLYWRPTTEPGDPIHERQLFSYTLTTDAQGRFAVARLVDGTSEIGRQFALPGGESFENTHIVRLNLKPGETKSGIQIGGTGRPVVADVVAGEEMKAKGLIPVDATLTLVPPPSFIRPANWDTLGEEEKTRVRLAYYQTDIYHQYLNSVREIGAAVSADGSMRFEDVPAGEYSLNVMVLRRSPEDPSFFRDEARATMHVVIPAMQGRRSDVPLDVGSLELKAVMRPNVGEMAPTFEPADFNKGQIKLSDYRGKFVLLDFWATWCGPCIAEFKHMEALHQTYANDPRFVMIGVSLDDAQGDPAKFLDSRKLPWLQAYGGPSAWTTFGIGAIPSVWLIGPDGKIIAKAISAEDLDRVVKEALAKGS